MGALITASAEGVAPSSKRWERQGEEAAPGNKDWQTQGHDDPPATKSVRLKIPGQRHTDEKTSFPTITSALPLGGRGGSLGGPCLQSGLMCFTSAHIRATRPFFGICVYLSHPRTLFATLYLKLCLLFTAKAQRLVERARRQADGEKGVCMGPPTWKMSHLPRVSLEDVGRRWETSWKTCTPPTRFPGRRKRFRKKKNSFSY